MRLLLTCLLMIGCTAMALADSPDRSKVPQPTTPTAVTIPSVDKQTLSNGVPVYFAKRNLPLANVVILIKAGAMQDPEGKYGLSSFTAETMDEGVGKYGSLQFAEAIEMMGGLFSIYSGYDSTLIRLTVPSSRLDKGLNLLSDLILRPNFPQEELDRIKADLLTDFIQERHDAGSLANAAFLNRLYGEPARFSQGLAGTAQSVAAFTREDVKAFHNNYYQPKNAAIIVTGGVNEKSVIESLEKHFSAWKNTNASEITRGSQMVNRDEIINSQVTSKARRIFGKQANVKNRVMARRDTKGRLVYIVDKPDAQQSVLRVGSVGISRNSPFYMQLKVMNTILGGSFTSRLNQNLREKNGYTYGASSNFASRIAPGPFLVSTSVQTDKTAAAVNEIMNELAAIRKPFTDSDLTKARNYLAYSYPKDFETGIDLANAVANMILYELPDNYYRNYVPELLKVNNESMNKPRFLYFDPNKMCVVIVGDSKKVVPQIEKMGWRAEILPIDSFFGPVVEPKSGK